MPSFRKNEINAHAVESMDAKALQALLREDFEWPGGMLDSELRALAVQTLCRREKEGGAVYPDAEASLKNFRQRYGQLFDTGDNVAPMPSGAQGRKRSGPMRVHNVLVRSAAAIVAVVMLLSMSALAGRQDAGDRGARWTDGEFWFDWTAMDIEPMEQGSGQVQPQLEKLRELLTGYVAQPEDLLPSYLPEGFAAYETKITDDTEWFAQGMCWLYDGESGRYMTVGCKIVYDKTMKFGIPKNSGAPEEYVRNGITHYIMPNASYYEAVWVNGDVQCSIGGQVSHDEMIKIIDSIYGEVK